MHAVAACITQTKTVLRNDNTLLRSLAKPFHRFCVILFHTKALVITKAKQYCAVASPCAALALMLSKTEFVSLCCAFNWMPAHKTSSRKPVRYHFVFTPPA